jgi:hypothetical protein
MKHVFLIIVSFLSIIQIHGQIKNTSQKPLLKEIFKYCLNDTINFISHEIFEYNSDYQKIKKEIITKRGDSFERFKYFYNDLGNIISEDYYRNNYLDNRDSIVLVHTTKYVYDSINKLISKIRKNTNDKNGEWEKVGKNCCPINLSDYTIKKDGNTELFYYNNGWLYKKIEYQDSVVASESYYKANKLEKRILYSYKDGKLTRKYTEYYIILDPDRKKHILDFHRRYIEIADSVGDREGYEKLTASYKELLNNDESFKSGNFESEEYFYKNELLFEERIINKGMDPCLYQCCGNYWIKYRYIE